MFGTEVFADWHFGKEHLVDALLEIDLYADGVFSKELDSFPIELLVHFDLGLVVGVNLSEH